MNRLMADMKVEEAERRARGLPAERERFADSGDAEDADMGDSDGDSGEDEEGGDGDDDRFMDVTRARRVQDPAMEADGSRWPRPG